MFSSDQYQLLDFGDGRRLERFGPLLLDRPCPAADAFAKKAPGLWTTVDARFDNGDADRGDAERGIWTHRGTLAERWTIDRGRLVMELKRTAFGHVGLFPEQAENWDWIAEQVAKALQRGQPPPKVLNLFAYTGGSTLAAAAAGAQVTHVDAAKNIVAWARRNAELSSLADAPIRWIADDAVKFVQRELRRGNRYDAVILDPPTYGHGTGGEVWRLAEDLPTHLADCAELTGPDALFVLLSCHTPGYNAARLQEHLARAWPAIDAANMEGTPLGPSSNDGRMLPSGEAARFGWRH